MSDGLFHFVSCTAAGTRCETACGRFRSSGVSCRRSGPEKFFPSGGTTAKERSKRIVPFRKEAASGRVPEKISFGKVRMTYRADRLFLAGDAGRTRQGERTVRRRTLPAAAIHGRLHTGPYIPLPIFVSPVPHEEARRPQPENPATAPSFRRSQDDTPIRKAMHRNPQRKSSAGLPCGSHYRKGPLSEPTGGDDERHSADKPDPQESGMRHF